MSINVQLDGFRLFFSLVFIVQVDSDLAARGSKKGWNLEPMYVALLDYNISNALCFCRSEALETFDRSQSMLERTLKTSLIAHVKPLGCKLHCKA